MITTLHETSSQKTAIRTIAFRFGTCTLGLVLVATTPQGICAILLGSDEKALVGQLRSIFPQAALQKDSKELDEVLNRVVQFVDTPTATLALLLDIRGTAFQKRVWKALRESNTYSTRPGRETAFNLRADPLHVALGRELHPHVADTHGGLGETPQLVGVLDELVLEAHRLAARVVAVDDVDDRGDPRGVPPDRAEDLPRQRRALDLMAAGDVGLPPPGGAGQALEVILGGHRHVADVMQEDRGQDDIGVGLGMGRDELLGQRVGAGDVDLVGTRLPVGLGELIDPVIARGVGHRVTARGPALTCRPGRPPSSAVRSITPGVGQLGAGDRRARSR